MTYKALNKINKIYQKTRSKEILPLLDELEYNQWLSLEELNKLQNIKLFKIINLAIENVPYYINLKNEMRLDSKKKDAKDIIKQFPILTKYDLINNYDDLINPEYIGDTYQNYSGGSTGLPVKLLQDRIMQNYSSAAAIRSDKWAGWDFGSSIFKFWGASKDWIGYTK